MRKKRKAWREKLVAEAKDAIKEYKRQRRQGDWRIYVQTITGVTPRTLDRWFKDGLIEAPIERKGRS